MSDFIIFALAAVCGYLAGSINPAVIASKLFYKRDIRDLGSGNPGFTNFKRNFGNTAYLVMAVDFSAKQLLWSPYSRLFFHVSGTRISWELPGQVSLRCWGTTSRFGTASEAERELWLA